MPVSKTKATAKKTAARAPARKIVAMRLTADMREKALMAAIQVSGVDNIYTSGAMGGSWPAQPVTATSRRRFTDPDDIVKTAAKFAAFLANG